jgi:glutamate synthase (NADPH) small chain
MAPKKRTIRTIPQDRTPVRELDPVVRGKNFEEVNCGYVEAEALVESERCLLCADEPCVRGCPVGIDIPGFIKKIGEKNFHGAYDVITDTNLLPAVCGRVCPQENQCEGVCTVGESLEPVAIGRLERFIGDMAIREGWSNVPYIEPSGFRVGIVGSGPAGMACAADMAKAGCEVIVFEAFHEAGGVLKYGIPDFRLPNEHRGRRARQARAARHPLRVQHPGRAAVHHRRDARGDGLPRGVHRHRRRLPELHGHSRRVAQRRAVRQRAA